MASALAYELSGWKMDMESKYTNTARQYGIFMYSFTNLWQLIVVFWLFTLQRLFWPNITRTRKTDPPYARHINLSHPFPERKEATHVLHKWSSLTSEGNTPSCYTNAHMNITIQRSHYFHILHSPRPWKELFWNYQHLPPCVEQVRGSYRKSWATIFCKVTCFIIDKPNTPP